MALSMGNDDRFFAIIQKGVDVVSYRCNNLSLLHLACKYGRFNVVKYLIDHRRDLDIR